MKKEETTKIIDKLMSLEDWSNISFNTPEDGLIEFKQEGLSGFSNGKHYALLVPIERTKDKSKNKPIVLEIIGREKVRITKDKKIIKKMFDTQKEFDFDPGISLSR